MPLHIVFSHGKESGPWGSKIASMVEHVKPLGEIHSIDYQDLKLPDERVQRLSEYLNGLSGNIVLVGSSMGGYVSTIASSNVNVKGLMLLAPAFYLNGYNVSKPTTRCKHVCVVHGWNDDIVPYQNSIEFAYEHKALLKLVNDAHRLAKSHAVLNAELENIITKII